MSAVATTNVSAELSLTRNWAQRVGLCAFVVLVIGFPLFVSDGYWISIASFAGIAATATIGLNLLMGYAGEISIGQSFFVGVGAYTAIFFGVKHGQPFIVWFPAVAVVGALTGGLLAPIALRIRGIYFVVVTIGLVFFGIHLFNNWASLTGGPAGINATMPLSIGPIDFAQLELVGHTFTRAQSVCVLIWLTVLLSLLLVKNIGRSRAGRAMQASRDNDLAAEVAGVSLFRVKSAAFVVSGMLGALAGALLAAQIQYVVPEQFNLTLAFEYLSILIVGGMGSTFGPVVGAVVVGALPQFLDRFGESLPLVKAHGTIGGGWGLTIAQFTLFSYGVLIVLFLMLEPRGLTPLIQRLWTAIAGGARAFARSASRRPPS